MTLRRAVALAQALTLIALLLPGAHLLGPALVRGAAQPAEPEASIVYDAAGKGIGCQAGSRKYKGPGLPKDPPWPPGAEPTPSPEPTAAPTTEPTEAPATDDPSSGIDRPADASADGDDQSTSVDGSEEAQARAPTAVVAGEVARGDVRLAQADIGSDPPLTQPRSGELLTGIDVSHHNGDIDFGKVREAGHRFVFMKATQDNDFVDPRFPTNVARARAAGLLVGAYHFFDYTLDGRAQADHFLDRVEAAGGLEAALPPVVDVECWAPIGPSIHAVSSARLRDFVDRVYERSGRLPIVYTSVYMWREVVGNAEGFEDLPLWAACWGCEAPPSLAPGWDDWTFWQTGLYRIRGVGRLDGNYFVGSREQLADLLLRPVAIEGGALATSRAAVGIDLGGRVATHVRTSPDGETWTGWSRVRSLPQATLPATEGEHELHVQLRNGSGAVSPVYRDSIVVDRTPPQVSPPTVALRTGAIAEGGGSALVSVAWESSDALSGLADASVLTACEERRAERVEVPGSAEPGERLTGEGQAALIADATCDLTVIARDGAGNSARSSLAGIATAYAAGPTAAVAGEQVGVVARRGPDAGRAVVLLDGEALGLVDLYAPDAGEPEVVFVADLPGSRHDISVEPTGSDGATATDASIVGFVTLATPS